jgi:16S rRNA (guanine527-N7)-methyltransferase
LAVFADLLRQRVADIPGLASLTDSQITELQAHYDLMVRWNKSLNLTKIIQLAEAVDRHYVESLFLAAHLPAGSLRIVDIGSGPGFPGFPVAVVRPDCEITLIESHQRKAVFLREASRTVSNVRVVAKRAEEVSERFDWAISRAVSYNDLALSLPTLSSHVALLTGAEGPPLRLGTGWEQPVPVPGGNSSFLRVRLSRF